MSVGILATGMMLAMMGVPSTDATQPVVRLQDQLPFGVFWAWERCLPLSRSEMRKRQERNSLFRQTSMKLL